MRPHLLIPAALIALGACRGDAGTSDAIVVRDSSGVAIVENDLLRLTATCALGSSPVTSIGEEDGGEEYLLTSVSGARRLSDGRIVLANARSWQLRYYEANGQYIRSSGRQGEGPGEFRQPYSIQALPGDTVYAGDIRPFRFLVFAPVGQWVRTIDAKPLMINSPNFIGVLDDGRWVLGLRDLPARPTGANQFALQSMSVLLHDANGTLTDTIATIPNGRSGMIIPESRFSTMPFFESYAHVAARGALIVIGHGAERELRLLGTGPGTPLQRLVRWTGESREVTTADVEAEKDRERREFATYPPGVPTAMLETQVSDQRPVAEVMPAMNGIRLGTDGRIWIREYQTQSDTSSRRWVGFRGDGRFDCRLATPRYRDFLEFGEDYLIVLDTDSLGVERVKQFPLSRVRRST